MDGEVFRHIRKQYGYTQQTMAEVLGYSVRSVVAWERGQAKVPTIVSRFMRIMQKMQIIFDEADPDHPIVWIRVNG